MASVDATIVASVITASAATTVAVLAAVVAYLSEKRTRRRTLYGEAYKAATAWKEMLYKLRRRRAGNDVEDALVAEFHTLQREIDYHIGWIGSESVYMQRSYDEFVFAVKEVTEPLISEAWDKTPAERPSLSQAAADHADLSAASRSFLFDVRCHLAWWQLPKLFVIWRNRRWLRRARA